MNTLIKAIILSLSSALVAAPVIAAPQKHHSQQHDQQQHTAQHQTKDSIKAPQHSIKKTERPSHDWQQGHKVPTQYHGNSFKVDASKYKKLSKPTKNQQWIKVNRDYVLMNTATYKVIKVIQG
ncbi:RcnB family protein [Acinetobacter bohemicus]|jgi:Ni/Co efflux regulator RcnB|uniref:Regulator RcnB of Ni and Co efflux n=1 Tax=Acinetobacter bohemicus TaxID=1435036 RepID=A0A1I6VYQ3_9GAMM|nr:RcnB family protein [Acinetobacter bohemicus]KAB0650798.1 RcnB family protein [Acinetobacter bohemicus]SFT18833.1 regulator RcnB of Ni and Co efflux [Acinetobacter bohemicus]